MSLQFPYICCMPRIHSKLRREPCWGCCCLNTISLPLAYHVLIVSSPCATRPELPAICEGSRFGVGAVCIPSPYQLLTMPVRIPYHLLHAQNWQPGARGTVLGLLLFANNILTNCAPCPGASFLVFVRNSWGPRTCFQACAQSPPGSRAPLCTPKKGPQQSRNSQHPQWVLCFACFF